MSHSAGDMPLSLRRISQASALALACAALVVSGCSDDLKVANQDARIVLVGDLNQAGELCEFTETAAQTRRGGLSEDIISEDADREDAVSEDAVSEDAVSEDAVSEDAVSEDAVSEDAVSEDAVSEDAVSEDAVSEDAGQSPDAGDDTPLPSGRAELERDGDMLAIPYLILDREGDAQSLKVEICAVDGDCGIAIAGTGGAGASGVSTSPANQCVLHVFNWKVGCGRFVGVDEASSKPVRQPVNLEDEYFARISVVDSNESPGQSTPFTLKALGFDALPHCE